MTLDHFVGRMLFVEAAPANQNTERAKQAFGFSLFFSATRCILQYVILPFVLPLIGVASEFAIPLTFAINVVAIVMIFLSLRRFWQIRYQYRWQYLGVAAVALVILTVFMITDLRLMLS